MSEVEPLRFENLRLLRILLNHSGQLPAIFGYIDAIKTADSYGEKWESVKSLGDVLVPIAQELKDGFHTADTLTTEALKAQALGLGLNFADLIANLPAIYAAIQTIRDLIALLQRD